MRTSLSPRYCSMTHSLFFTTAFISGRRQPRCLDAAIGTRARSPPNVLEVSGGAPALGWILRCGRPLDFFVNFAESAYGRKPLNRLIGPTPGQVIGGL